jgi:hypothetical protein
MPDGDNPLPAPTQMVEEFFFIFGTDADHTEVETEDTVGYRNQTVADRKSGQGFDHGWESPQMAGAHPKVRPGRIGECLQLEAESKIEPYLVLASSVATGGFTLSGMGSMPYFHFRYCSPVDG